MSDKILFANLGATCFFNLMLMEPLPIIEALLPLIFGISVFDFLWNQIGKFDSEYLPVLSMV